MTLQMWYRGKMTLSTAKQKKIIVVIVAKQFLVLGHLLSKNHAEDETTNS